MFLTCLRNDVICACVSSKTKAMFNKIVSSTSIKEPNTQWGFGPSFFFCGLQSCCCCPLMQISVSRCLLLTGLSKHRGRLWFSFWICSAIEILGSCFIHFVSMWHMMWCQQTKLRHLPGQGGVQTTGGLSGKSVIAIFAPS